MTDLVRYDAMCRAIDAAYKVDEVKDIRDKAVALEHYARQARNTEAEQRACEIRLRAERRAGQLLKKVEKAKGALRRGNTMSPRGDDASTLANLGVSKKQSSDWQKLADVPDQQFEAALADPTAKPTTAGIIRATAEPGADPVSTDALWLWGRLKDFVRNGVVDRDPADVMATMTPEMKDDVHTLAPRVAAWLRRIGATAIESMPESAMADKSPSWRNLAAPGSLLKSDKKRGGQ
jgi:hypothetical protein